MPHVNHRRGDTVKSVFRKEHGRFTHRTCHKDKRMSWKWYKRWINKKHRLDGKEAIRRFCDDPKRYPAHRALKNFAWIAT